MAWRESRGATVALGAWVLVQATLPSATRVALGAMVGTVPLAARQGWASASGHRVIVLGVLGAVGFALGLLLNAAGQTIDAVVTSRLTCSMQARLMAAVATPAGIAHLEDPDVLDRIGLAQGALTNANPAAAPGALARAAALRIGGVVGCVIVAGFRWWLGLAMLIFWVWVRITIREATLVQVRTMRGEATMIRRASYFANLATAPAAAKELRLFGLSDWVIGRYRHCFFEGMTLAWKSNSTLQRRVVLVGSLAVVVNVGACGVLAQAAYNGHASLGTVAVVVSTLTLIPMIGTLMWDDIALEFMVASIPDLDDVEKRLQPAQPGRTATASPAGLPSVDVRFHGVRFTYPGGTSPVFDGLDLQLRAGESTAIVGSNGAGKTTLIKLLSRLHDPSGGRILVDGVDLAALDPGEWQRRVAVIFQDFVHYPLSAADNVDFGAVEHLGDALTRDTAAARAGAVEVVQDLPQRWDTVLSREYTDGADLSGGQWQRVALARALFAVEHGAGILVLDEPTAWLDARGEADFFNRFLEITRGLTTVVISHRFSTVRRADTIAVIDDGKVIEHGKHAQLVALDGTYAAMFRVQAERFSDAASEAGS